MASFQLVANRPVTGDARSAAPVVFQIGGTVYHLNNQHDLHNESPCTTYRYPFHKRVDGAWVALTGPLMRDQDPIPDFYTYEGPATSGTRRFWTHPLPFVVGTLVYFAGWELDIDWSLYEYTPPYQSTIWRVSQNFGSVRPLLRIWDSVGETWTDKLYPDDMYHQHPWGYGLASAWLPDAGTSGKFVFQTSNGTQIYDLTDDTWLADAQEGNYNCALYWQSSGESWDTWFAQMGYVTQFQESYYDVVTYAGSHTRVQYTGEREVQPLSVPSRGPYTYPGYMVGPSWYRMSQEVSKYLQPYPYLTWSWYHPGHDLETLVVKCSYAGRQFHRVTIDADQLVDVNVPYSTDYGDPSFAYNLFNGQNNRLLTNYYSIYKFSGGGDETPPTVAWTEPDNLDTISGMKTLLAHVTDNVALDFCNFFIDGILLQKVTFSGTLTSADPTAVLNTLSYADGSHTLRATVYDKAGNYASATITVTIDNADPPADTTAPVVDITAPANLAVVEGVAGFSALCTDDVELDYARLRIDTTQYGSDISMTGQQSAVAQWSVDFTDWSNGTYLITVTAWDKAGNMGYDTIQVVVNNMAASEPRYLYLKPQPVDAGRWRLGDDKMVARMQMLAVQAGVLPVDPKQKFNVYVGYQTSTTTMGTPNFDEFTIIEEGSACAIPANAKYIRWGLKAVPSFRTTDWHEDEIVEWFRILPTAVDTVFYLIGLTPASLWYFNNGTITLVVDLNVLHGVTTISDVCVQGDKIWFATELGLLYYDLDASQLSAIIRFDQATPATTCVQVRSNKKLMVKQGGKLYEFDFASTTLLSDTPPAGIVREIAGGIVIAADSGGTNSVSRLNTDGTWTAIGSILTQEAVRIWDEAQGSYILAHIGTTDGSWVTSPSFYQDGTFGVSVRAYARWIGYLWAAGDLSGLWRQLVDGSWQKYDTLVEMEAIHDMVVIGDYLWMVGRDYEDKARLIAFFVDEGGSFQCGVTPPDVFATVLQYTKTEEA